MNGNEVRLSDFGESRLKGTKTKSTYLRGTPLYMPPELQSFDEETKIYTVHQYNKYNFIKINFYFNKMNKFWHFLFVFAILFLFFCPELKAIQTLDSIRISSPEFSSNSSIPDRYTLYGENIRPELDISNIPSSVSSLAVIVDDPDAVSGLWTHWIVVNISKVEVLKEKEIYGS